MPSVQVRDILESLRTFYSRLAERFSRERTQAEGERLQILLECIANHERQLESGIAQFEDESADTGLLDTWLQFGAAETLDQIIGELELDCEMTESEVLASALQVDSKLVDLYEELGGETSVPDVCEFFQNLVKMQDARTRQLAQVMRES